MSENTAKSINKFMVLSTQRTGSTLFCLWLNSHPCIRCHGEVFLKQSGALDSISHFFRKSGLLGFIAYELAYNPITKRVPFNPLLDRQSKQFLYSLLNNREHSGPWTDPENWHDYHPQSADDPIQVVGFKMMYNTLHNLRWLKRNVHDKKYHIIHVVRENWLKSYVSYLRLKKTNQSSVSDPTKLNRQKVSVHIPHMLAFFEQMQRTQAYYRSYYSENPFFECSYEKFTSDPSSVAEEICGFLEVDNLQMKLPQLKKISSGNLCDDIENYEQVAKALAGTKWHIWL